MDRPDKAKPATAETVNGLRNFELLAGGLDDNNNLTGLQVQRFRRKFGFALETAIVVASLAWGMAR